MKHPGCGGEMDGGGPRGDARGIPLKLRNSYQKCPKIMPMFDFGDTCLRYMFSWPIILGSVYIAVESPQF